VLIVDDDRALRFALQKALGRLGYDVSEASSGEQALEVLRRPSPPDAALLDLKMEGMGGLDVLRRRGSVSTRIVVLTGHGTVSAAVEAMQLGAFSFLEKPVDAEILGPLLAQAIADHRREDGATEADRAPPLIGASEPFERIRAFIARVGPTGETVAIYGETGTGKEVVARHIHIASPRAGGPFVALNAACVPENLFESELFGFERGAFTGAVEGRKGLFREAEGGTLFLDEVAEMPLELQAKLLRALESRCIRPVGASKEIPVDVRIIAASNRDLRIEVRDGRFREDLYFRLDVFPVVVPPLRHRKADIPLLAEHLLGRVGASVGLTEDAAAVLCAHDWPGNVRELLNVLRRAALFVEGDSIDGELTRRMIAASVFAHGERTSDPGEPHPAADGVASSSSLADVERSHIEKVLEEQNGNVTRAATALGIDRRTLQRKLRSYGIGVED